MKSGDTYATRFSNKKASLMSSLGVFTTGTTYLGKHGVSLYLDGLEPGFNDNARQRAVVVHGADYVDTNFVVQHRRAGRSWGCPALPVQSAGKIIDALRDGALLVSWFPDPHWLATSRYLMPSSD